MKSNKYNVTKRFLGALLLILIMSSVFLPKCMAYSIQEGQRVYDDANLFTSDEIHDLEKSAKAIYDKWNIDVFILTADNPDACNTDAYIDAFKVAACNDGPFVNDSVFLLINLYDRNVAISGYGTCKETIDFDHAEKIRKHITPKLSDYKWAKACDLYLSDIRKYVGKEYWYFYIFAQLGISFGLACLVVAIMAFTRGSKITTNSRTYLNTNTVNLRAQHDNYIRTVVTKRQKPKNNSNGGSGSHSSSGGGGSHSHSSGHF